MNFALTFNFYSARYSVHAVGCSAAIDTRKQVLLNGTFETIEAASAHAHAEESEKAERDAKALLTVCKCTRIK